MNATAKHFDNIADRIIEDFDPESVVDLGSTPHAQLICNSLRKRGVKAGAYNMREYDIGIGFLTSFDKDYVARIPNKSSLDKADVVMCIDVLGHVGAIEGIIAVRDMTNKNNTVIFSAPVVEDRTKAYWVKRFKDRGFERGIVDVSYVNKDAMVFTRKSV